MKEGGLYIDAEESAHVKVLANPRHWSTPLCVSLDECLPLDTLPDDSLWLRPLDEIIAQSYARITTRIADMAGPAMSEAF